LEGIVTPAQATDEQVKDNIAASYEAARATFQRAYTRKNKLFAVVLSLFVVGLLNANLIILYEQISADQVAQQAIVGKAAALGGSPGGSDESQGKDLGGVYSASRKQIVSSLRDYPILIRTSYFGRDFDEHPYSAIPGLLIMSVLVSMGAPFWNDVLKGMMGVNSALNAKNNGSS
jgi:hypothetical protein